jgi:hypothetical protein
MMTTTHPLAEDYLRRLEQHARVLPRSERAELIAEIRNHMSSGLTPDSTEADVRNLLDALGPPADIVEAARPEHPPVRRGAREAFALVLLVSGLPPVVGWLAGVGLLLWSPLWTARQKLLGILVWPGGYVAVLAAPYTMDSGTCEVQRGTDTALNCTTSGPPLWLMLAVLAVMVIAPLVVAVYLYRAAGRRGEST